MIKIQWLNYNASILSNKWHSDNTDFQLLLNRVFDQIGSYAPWPDYALAEMACKALGGKIIEATDPPEYIEGRVY